RTTRSPQAAKPWRRFHTSYLVHAVADAHEVTEGRGRAVAGEGPVAPAQDGGAQGLAGGIGGTAHDHGVADRSLRRDADLYVEIASRREDPVGEGGEAAVDAQGAGHGRLDRGGRGRGRDRGGRDRGRRRRRDGGLEGRGLDGEGGRLGGWLDHLGASGRAARRARGRAALGRPAGLRSLSARPPPG